jgi:hypothetical protein
MINPWECKNSPRAGGKNHLSLMEDKNLACEEKVRNKYIFGPYQVGGWGLGPDGGGGNGQRDS